MLRGSLALALALALVLAAGAASASVVWRGDFSTGDLSQWNGKQMVSPDRLQVVFDDTLDAYAMRTLVKNGDDPIDASHFRNEVAYSLDDARGKERFYAWSTLWPADYRTAPYWQIFTQWHQTGLTGSPPFAFQVWGEEIVFGSHEGHLWRAPFVRGKWHDFIVHVKWSDDRAVGFVEVTYNGQVVLPKRTMATLFPGQGIYLKQTIASRLPMPTCPTW